MELDTAHSRVVLSSGPTTVGLAEKDVMVGGAPLNQEFGDAIGADGYCRDAAVAAETAKELVLARRGYPEPAGPSVAV